MIALILAILLLVLQFGSLVVQRMFFEQPNSYEEIQTCENGFLLENRYWGWASQSCLGTIVLLELYMVVQSIEFEKSSVVNHGVFAVFMLLLLYDTTQSKFSSGMKIFRCIVNALVLGYTVFNCIEYNTVVSLLSFLCASLSLGCLIKASYFNSYKVVSTVPTAEYTCDLFSYISFSYLNPILIDPICKKVSMEYEDMPPLQDVDSAEYSWNVFKEAMDSQTSNGAHKDRLNLVLCIIHLIKKEWMWQGLFHLLQSCIGFITPLALQRILLYIADSPQTEAVLPVSVHVAVALLFVSPFIESIAENQNERATGHIEVQIQAAMINAVYHKALAVDLYGCKESIGKINNLMSVDVEYMQEFFGQAHFLWSTPLEVIIATVLLFRLLGSAAWGAIVVMAVCLMFAMEFEQRLEAYIDEMLVHNDSRINTVGEVLNNIRIIKYSCWEKKFMKKINELRKLQLKSVRSYAIAYALLIANWEIVPTLIATVSFTIYCYVMGKPLLASTGFAAMTIFNCLRFPLSQFPEVAGVYIQAKISLKRFEGFLKNEDIKGLPSPETSSTAKPTANMKVGTVQMKDVSLGWPASKKEGTEDDSDEDEDDERENCLQATTSTFKELWEYRKNSRASHAQDKTLSEKARESNKAFGTAVNPEKKPLIPDKKNNTYSSTASASSGVRVDSKRNQEPDEESEEDSDSESESSKKTKSSAKLDKSTSKKDESESGDEDEDEEEDSYDGVIVLEELNLRLSPKSLNVVVGVTGAGKSTLLQGGLLGECNHLEGETLMKGTVSYVSQTAWIQHATLRDNVLFGLPYEKERYEKVLFACSLEGDLLLLPKGDMTEIGERGVNLSGGQQQRVSLARAAYAKSDIILLDDPLSAVDAHVGEHIFRELIQGFLSDRTRVLVTHNLALAVPAADKVICIDNNSGSIFAQCNPTQLPFAIRAYHKKNKETMGVFYSRLIEIVEHSVTTIKENKKIKGKVAIPSASPRSKSHKKSEETVKDSVAEKAVKKSAADHHKGSHPPTSPSLRASPSHRSRSRSTSFDPTGGGKSALAGDQVDIETKGVGEIGLDVYWMYFKACGGWIAAVGLVGSCFGTSMAWLVQNICLGTWMHSMQHTTDGSHAISDEINPTFIYYALSSLLVLICILFKAVWSVQCTTKAAQTMHDRLMYSVILAPCSWFDATPVGRIVNRFSQDISTVDESLMIHLMFVIDTIVEMSQILVVIVVCLPVLLIALVPIIICTIVVGSKFLHVTRELKRLESIKKSPVFVLFSESLQGLSTIRAFRQEDRFSKLCHARLDELNRCHLYLWLCDGWLSFRIQLLSATITGCVGVAVVMYAKTIGSTVAGIVLIYSLAFCDNIMWLAYEHAECQMDMNSVERIEEYSTLTSEKYLVDLSVTDSDTDDSAIAPVKLDAPIREDTYQVVDIEAGSSSIELTEQSTTTLAQWPTNGSVTFDHIYLSYKANAAPILRDVCFTIPGRMKVGIVGRTGAGKSSLIAALFRIVEPYSGGIWIDGVNTLDLPIQEVRRNIAIVPQDPTLFAASVRFNLDPFDQYTDDEIWSVLESVHMAEHVASMSSGSDDSDDESNDEEEEESASDKDDSVVVVDVATRGDLRDKMVLEKGSNFSVGQRQLLCLARAMLRKASVLVLDECTASVDHQTDGQIQETVRSQLTDSTVICIAHRLHTVAYYDRVIVMDKGSVIEYDDPYELMNKSSSQFHEMCVASGDFNELYKMAKSAHNERQIRKR